MPKSLSSNEKCFKCGVKVKSIDVIQSTCKCKKIFCKTHFFAGIKDSNKSHLCSFDYHGDAQQMIKSANPVLKDNIHRSKITDI